MTEGKGWLDRLVHATNDHDLDALVACFAEDYENLAPAHPARGFRGRDQVRRNWQQIFAFVPDLRAEVLGVAYDERAVWTEWEMRGTRRDGSPHRMAGVILFEVIDGRARRARFFLEPVDESADGVWHTRHPGRAGLGLPRIRMPGRFRQGARRMVHQPLV